MSARLNILKGAYRKLDGMVLSFGLPIYSDYITDAEFEKYLGGDLNDALREMRMVDCNGINSMSIEEMYLEIRTVYYALRRFRNSASVFFKFSTAVDGKSVDKSMIPKMLNEMITEYNNDFVKWKSTGIGRSWTMSRDRSEDYADSI